MPTISPALNGAIKGLLTAVLTAVVAYLANPEHLSFLSATTAMLVAAVFSALESSIKVQTGNGLLGAVKVR